MTGIKNHITCMCYLYIKCCRSEILLIACGFS
nr:MAG TPA: hypothetical protein [Bacteriophage sp.]